MHKVKIDAADHRTFSVAAEELGVTVEEWLSDAGRARALAPQVGRGRRGEAGIRPRTIRKPGLTIGTMTCRQIRTAQ